MTQQSNEERFINYLNGAPLDDLDLDFIDFLDDVAEALEDLMEDEE